MRSTLYRRGSVSRSVRGPRGPEANYQPTPWQPFAIAAAFALALLVVVFMKQSWLALTLIGVSAAVVALYQRRETVALVPARARVNRNAPSRCVWKLDSEA